MQHASQLQPEDAGARMAEAGGLWRQEAYTETRRWHCRQRGDLALVAYLAGQEACGNRWRGYYGRRLYNRRTHALHASPQSSAVADLIPPCSRSQTQTRRAAQHSDARFVLKRDAPVVCRLVAARGARYTLRGRPVW
jgi:hypothetical protein